MTKEQVESLLEDWKQRLGLGHWNIKVNWDMPVELGVDAEIKIHNDYEQASIRIQQRTAPADDEADRAPTRPFTEWTDKEGSHVIVHELLHIFEKQTSRAVQAAESSMSKPAYELLWSWYSHGSENWVDRLAQVLVSLGGS